MPAPCSRRLNSSPGYGGRPALPPHLADLMDRPERMTRVANDQAAIERLIRARARITREA